MSAELPNRFHELLLQALEHEMGGVSVYETAIKCATHPELAEEWGKYLEQTRHHVEVLEELCSSLGIDSEEETPGRQIVRHMGESLVQAMDMAIEAGDTEAAQLVAAECVVIAETKDHLNWELLGKLAEARDDEPTEALLDAYEEVEDEEDEHLYHSRGWCRELWLQSLGLEATLPPPEEQEDVRTMADAARVEQESLQRH